MVSNRSHSCLADRSAAAGVEHVMFDVLPIGKAVQGLHDAADIVIAAAKTFKSLLSDFGEAGTHVCQV